MSQTREYKGHIYQQQADGSWKKVGPAQPQMPSDPTYPYQAPQARADVDKTVTDIEDTREDNRRDDTRLAAELFKEGLRVGSDGQIERIPGWTPPEWDKPATVVDQEGKQKSRQEKSRVVRSIMSQVIDYYKNDIQGQPASRLFGLTEKIDGLPANERFTKTAMGMLALIRPMVAQGAKDGDSDKEMEVFLSYIPDANDADITIESKLRSLEMLLSGVVDGKLPSEVDMSGRLETPFVDGALGYNSKGEPVDPDAPKSGSVWDKTYFAHGEGPGLADPNATEKSVELPKEYQERYDAFVMQGGFTPEQYADFRTALDKEYFPNAALQRETYIGEGQRILDQMERGGTINTKISGPTVSMTEREQRRNEKAQNTVGSTFIGLANGLSAGGLEGLEYERMQMARENAPFATAGGEILGAVATTGGIGAAGRFGASRIAPKVLEGGGKAQFARNLLTDAGYGAAYGGMTEGNPLGGALEASVGSAGGQAAGSIIGRGIGGAALSDAQKTMRDRGVSLMPGQAMRDSGWIGRSLNRMEEAAESIPGFGQLIRQRREDSFRDFNRAAFGEGLSSIGRQTRNIGEEGVEEAIDAYGGAFDEAFNGVRLLPDNPYTQGMNDAVFRGSQGKFGDDFNRIMDDDIAPIFNPDGSLAGRGVQDMLEVTGDNARYYDDLARGKVGGGVREPQARAQSGAFRAINEGTEGLIERQSPDVLSKYGQAKEAFRNTKVLQDAVHRARNGTRSGEASVFTPSQLADAAAANAKKYGSTHGTTAQPFRELTKAGQEALPSNLPNSGTFDRAIANGLVAAPVVGSAYAANEGWISPEAAAALAVASGAYSRTGQKVLNRVLFDRPEALRQLGRNVRKRKGLFGSAAVVPAITIE